MTYRIPSRVAHYIVETDVDDDEGGGPPLQIFLRRVPGGENLILVGEAALIWLLAADGVADVVAEVAEAAGHPLEVVRSDVEEYVGSLVAQGLLEQAPDRGTVA